MGEMQIKEKAGLKKLFWCCVLPIALVIAYAVQPFLPQAEGKAIAGNFFLWLLMLALTGGLIMLAGRWIKELGFGPREFKMIAGMLFFLAVAGAVFFRIYYSMERDIKVYDFSNFWRSTLERRITAGQSLSQLFGEAVDSLNKDYTYVAVIPLIPLSYVFGTQYAGFVFSIYFIYYMPACFFLTIYAMRLLRLAGGTVAGAMSFNLCLLAGAMLPGFLLPVLNGYPDVMGVLLVALMLNATFYWNGSILSRKHIFGLAAASLLLLVARRWYAYYIVGFYTALGVDLFLTMFASKRFSFRKAGNFVLNITSIAALCCLVVLLLNQNIFITFLGRDYATEYSAVKTVAWWSNLWQIAKGWGLLYLCASFGGLVFLCRKRTSRMICIRLVVCSATAFGLFSMVQNLDPHHYYLVTIPLFVFICTFINIAVQLFQKEKASVLLITFAVTGIANFLLAFVPGLHTFSYLAQPFTSNVVRYPKVYKYFDTISHLLNDLKELTNGTSKSVYVVGANDYLSEELLKRINLPEETDSAPFVLRSNIMDQRDGFPSQLFMADYVLLNDPFIDSFDTVQQVNYQVYDMLMNDPEISSRYQLLTAYKEDNNNILLLEKVRPADPATVDNLKARLMEYYPNLPFVWQPDYTIALLEYDKTLAVDYQYWSNDFTFRHDGSKDIIFGWQDTEQFNSLQFVMASKTTPMELSVANQDGTIYQVNLDAAAWEGIDIDTAGSEYLIVRVTPLISGGNDNQEFLVKFQGRGLN